ncbi:gamma-glutamyl-gamma-aminobutyrate hydrolase family protein [Permianibacter aggregans]|uniref:gamma-glutamyl-gamma-aminobutyrate hydrolase n=1 Tax=Permianibacter aggregans TaxID=1510150 RepID=A0A4R6UYJ8_9GAMM|nr:gamma-glutamyl-gamma-aminobutyrate hydrolase family protein [Permianibacter aggregans]QGX41362.1 gamma-glutamyl-gamma-aminobutyrate hydrolase family protein [Permianibacter aggregans]TDQ51149.1 gamma-glutamyl-gamma-aminobutyrate hydrolase [Permianibacter aggregans]
MKPLVAIISDCREIGLHYYHMVGDKYVRAVERCSGVLPVLLPAFAGSIAIDDLVERFDGVLLTGSYSNVEPHRYGRPQRKEKDLNDPHRDETVLPLVPALVSAGVPVFGICRGFQEMNVAYGGTLHQEVHKVDGKHDHRENQQDPLDIQYGPIHDLKLAPDGIMKKLLNTDTIRVNSLHSQGIDDLAPSLAVEAIAPDGLVEAYRVQNAKQFALAVQWHPEWKAWENPVSMALFNAFGEACKARMQQRKV